jgi:hypothetical protein
LRQINAASRDNRRGGLDITAGIDDATGRHAGDPGAAGPFVPLAISTYDLTELRNEGCRNE